MVPPFLQHAVERILDRLQPIRQDEAGQLQRWLALGGERAAHRHTVAAHDLGRCILARCDAAFNLPSTAHVLLEFRPGVPVGLRDGLRSFLEILEVAELVGHLGQHLVHGKPDRLLGIRDDRVDRDGERTLDLAQQLSQIGGAHTVEAALEQPRTRETVAHDPEHVLRLVGLQPIDREAHVALGGELLLKAGLVSQA